VIKKEGSKFVLHSKDGSKKLGEFATREEAVKREKQINFFKALETHPELRKKVNKKA